MLTVVVISLTYVRESFLFILFLVSLPSPNTHLAPLNKGEMEC